MLKCCEVPLAHHAAVYLKYSNHKYRKASRFVEDELAILGEIQQKFNLSATWEVLESQETGGIEELRLLPSSGSSDEN
jgi:hypothetical protein